MNTTQIKRLYQSDKEFVPITLAEAVVVNTTNIPNWNQLGITTLDKVLSTTLGIVGDNTTDINTLNDTVAEINKVLLNKQDKLTPGTGITITEKGVISATASIELYKIVVNLPPASEKCLNTIYLVYNPKGAEGNAMLEYICIYSESTSSYIWEQLGTLSTEVNLDNYITLEELTLALTPINTKISNIEKILTTTISARDVTTSTGVAVSADYEIPKTLYDKIQE